MRHCDGLSDDFKLGGLAGGAEAVTLRLGLPEDFASAALTAALVSFLRRMSLQCQGWLERPWLRRSWAMTRWPRDARKNIWSSKASALSNCGFM
jgi:hypothetical protein